MLPLLDPKLHAPVPSGAYDLPRYPGGEVRPIGVSRAHLTASVSIHSANKRLHDIGYPDDGARPPDIASVRTTGAL